MCNHKQAIMGTEMSRHMAMLDQLNTIDDPEKHFCEAKGQSLLVKTVIHSADLSGQAL